MNEECKIFIGNLSFKTSKESLEETFVTYGTITDVSIPVDKESGRPRGFAFITFEEATEADAALAADGLELDGRGIRVNKAQKKERSSAPRGGGGGFGRPSRF